MNKLPARGWLRPYDTSPYSIRFELGGEIFSMAEPVARFTQAYDRARAVANHVFQNSSRILGIVSWFPGDCDLVGQTRDRLGLEGLAVAGFQPGAPIVTWVDSPPWLIDEDKIDLTWQAFDLTNAKHLRDVLLWCAISDEMPIQPDAAAISYFYDPDAEVVLHIYDDRGMDLTSLSATTLRSTYDHYAGWLLDWDRPRMEAVFGPPKQRR
jgi:hypothetical protein